MGKNQTVTQPMGTVFLGGRAIFAFKMRARLRYVPVHGKETRSGFYTNPARLYKYKFRLIQLQTNILW